MSVRAKFNCMNKNDFPQEGGQVQLSPVFESKEGVEGNGCEENAVFGKWTPCGNIEMTILNPAAYAQFEVGKAYYVDFSPAE